MTPLHRIAVVGAGPKGTYALDSLASALDRLPHRPGVEVHIFEPHSSPGAGPVYDPDQPNYLRMNFANDKIDMWSRSPGTTSAGPSFVEYLEEIGCPADPGGYSPRALVGRYLSEGYRQIIDRLSAQATVYKYPVRVNAIEPAIGGVDGFDVHSSGGTITCCEVLLATGHESRSRKAIEAIPPYPVDQRGGLDDVEAGARVAVRGFGLTAVDVALALTEGRGGSFRPTDAPGRLRYEPTPNDAERVLPFSRTGRPMVSKPHPELGPQVDDREQRLEAVMQRFDALAESPDPAVAVERELVREAASLLADRPGSLLGRAAAEEDVCEHLRTLLSRIPAHPDEARAAMAADVEISFGRRPPGPDWALGEAWRLLYPAFVAMVENRCLDRSWPQFAKLAVEMERVAFGPPAENAARMLALVDSGTVDLGYCAGPDVARSGSGVTLQCGQSEVRADVLVDAVIAPPGGAPDSSPVIAGLLASGLARKCFHSTGLDVLPDGTCVGATGSPTPGLSAVGRPTEGSILGNDTLSRTLHSTPDRWAEAVARRLARTAVLV